MGNSQSSSADKAIRQRNRLSKPPSSIPTTKPAPSPKCKNLGDTTPYSYQSPWLDSTQDDSPVPQQPPSGRNASSQFTPDLFQPNGSVGDDDFNVTSEKESPMALATEVDALRRRLSAPCAAAKPNRFSLNLASAREDMPDVQTPLPNRRATIQDANELMSGLGLRFDEPLENKESKRYSAFRRNSLRIPGIATRIPEEPSVHVASPKDDDHYDHFDCCERQKSPRPSLLDVGHPRRRGLSPLRATTPNDFEYSYLGGLRPGSLHIVNGCASPTPSSLEPGSIYEKSAYSGACDGPRNVPLHEDCQQSSDLQRPPSPLSHHEEAIFSVEQQVHHDPLNAKSYEITDEELVQCTYPESVSHTQTVRLVNGVPSDPDNAPPPDLQTFERTPSLLVKSKSTALEDDLFEDEAVDVLMPQREDYPEEEVFGSCYKGFACRTPKTGSSSDYGSHIQKRNSNNLSKSDSGYSSASSKEPSQSFCGNFHRNEDKSDVSYRGRCSPIDDSTNRYPNSGLFGSPIPVNSITCEGPSAETTEETGPILPKPNTSPSLVATSSEHHSRENNHPVQRYYSNIETSSTSQEYTEPPAEGYQWTTYQPKRWPLQNDQTTPDEQYSVSRQFFQVMPHLNKPAISSTALPATPDQTSAAQRNHPRNSVPTTSQRPNSTGTITEPSKQPPSGKYISRMKSLVTLRGQKQSGRQTPRTSLPANHKQPQPPEQDSSNERRRRTNKLRRKSLIF